MKIIIIYHNKAQKAGKYFQKKLLEKNYASDEIVFVTFEELKEKLKKRLERFEKEIYIFLAKSKRCLAELAELNPLIEGKQLFLIIPDESEGIMKLAVKLYPRFMMRVDDSCDSLLAVLKKIEGSGLLM